MGDGELEAERIYKQALYESKAVLSQMSALELCEKGHAFQNELKNLVRSAGIPVSLLLGSLVSELVDICNTSGELGIIAGLELVNKHTDRSVESLKKYIDENFIKKE